MQMINEKSLMLLGFTAVLNILFLSSCTMGTSDDGFTAYFGGEVINPKSKYVLFYKDEDDIDSIPLDANNRFFVKFDSLSPGLYTFRHDPEYQYVYFDKNDSLLVLINSKDFDESIVFTGRGERKNNFLMEMYLRNERDRDSMFTVYDYDVRRFLRSSEKAYRQNLKYYDLKKKEIQWSDEFDVYARASVDLPYYSKKEVYPIIHKIRTGRDVMPHLPKTYYDFRTNVNLNDSRLGNYAPYVRYITHMLNNIAATRHRDDTGDKNSLALKANTSKMKIADTLIRDTGIKNMILNNIANNYLLEDQNMANNQTFFETYYKISTDKDQKNEIHIIANAIQTLKEGNRLPEVSLLTPERDSITSKALRHPTVIFFWTTQANTHLIEAHKKILSFRNRFPDYEYVAVNLDDDHLEWVETLRKFNFNGITQVRCAEFEEIRRSWAITKIHRTIVVNPDGTIRNGFTNIFDSDFEKNLKR